jgi:hypothetical protein
MQRELITARDKAGSVAAGDGSSMNVQAKKRAQCIMDKNLSFYGVA